MNSASSKSLIKRIKKLEAEVKKRALSRSRSRSRVPRHTNGRARSRSLSQQRYAAVRRGWRGNSTSSAESGRPLTKSADTECAVLPRVVETRNSPRHTESVCSAKSVVSRNACSVSHDNSPDGDVVLLHNDVILPSLSEDILNSLGDDPTKNQGTSFALHEQLVLRWQAILTNGLKKGDKQNLLNKYEVPENLTNLCPPKLNPEVKAALSKQNLATDSAYVELQNQLGKGLSALGNGINIILNNADKISDELKSEILSSLGDSGKILTSLFHRLSITRRNLVVPCLKNMKNLVENCVPSEFLFGSDLNEKLNTAKALENITKELRLPISSKNISTVRKTSKGGGSQVRVPSQIAPGTSQNLNFFRPARRTRETGPERGRTSRGYRRDSHKEWSQHRDKRKY